MVKHYHYRANHIVLEVSQRIPETKTYAPGQELVLNVSQGATANSLKQVVADLLLIPVEHILVAKHFPKKYEWLIIKENQRVKHYLKPILVLKISCLSL